MAKKFLIAIAAVVAVMAVLVLLPSFNKPATEQTQMNLDYSRQNLTKSAGAQFAATGADELTIANDGSARYSKLVGASDTKTFTVSSDDMKQLKDLILVSGFTSIPNSDYPQKEGVTNLTKFTLRVNTNGDTKTISWVDPDSSNGVPAIIGNVGTQLDGIISKYAG